jgi:Protein of unknown function (DUF3107)
VVPSLVAPGTVAPKTERKAVEVKIGIQSITRELVIETNSSPEEIERALASALADGGLFVLPDGKDGKVMVPADKIGYVEFSGVELRRVGFGNL